MRKVSIELYVSSIWVEDGFTENRELLPEVIREAIVSHCLPYAVGGEVKVRVTDVEDIEGPIPFDAV